jgi:superfamily II DNA or RNA helicase
VIPDEAHLSTARTWQQVLEHYAHAKILGFTATPYRLSGKPLASAYDRVVVIATPRELREAGHLSPYVGFSYKAPDLSEVEVVGEDYDRGQSAAAMSAITGDIVAEWLAHARDLSTVVFACTVEHSQALTAEFRAKGITAEHLDGKTPLFQRKSILARVESGATQVLCNVGIAVEGLDIPRLKCCVDAAPTMSLARAIQKWGRVRRPWKGQVARIHDHAFNIGTEENPHHGLPDADRDYSLHAKKEKPPSLSVCESCRAIYEGRTCPACGSEKEPEPRGERELAVVENAEQFGFSSEDAATFAAIDAATPAADFKSTVMLSWDTEGRVVEGVFEGAEEEKTSYGTRVRYVIRGAKRRYSVPETAQLRALLRAARVDHPVWIKYTGEAAISGGRSMKQFEVEVDDGR